MTVHDIRHFDPPVHCPQGDGSYSTVMLAIPGLRVEDFIIFPVPGCEAGARYRIVEVAPHDGRPGRATRVVHDPRMIRVGISVATCLGEGVR